MGLSNMKYIATLALCFILQLSTEAQRTTFTYQGVLTTDGQAARGVYDVSFALFNTASGGTQLGAVTNTGLGISNGIFTAQLDFGAGVFTGTNYWLELGVRTNGGASFITLNQRQPVLPAPYAIYATAVDGSGVTGAVAVATFSQNAADLSTQLKSAGMLNNSGNPLDWTQLKNVPAGLADGTDNVGVTSVTAGPGLSGGTITSSGTISLAQAVTSANLPNTIVGRDASGNFSAGNITATSFAGNGASLNGVPGTLPWQVISGTSLAASPNTGYLLTNDSQVTVLLPPAPNIGDIFRISATGAGGWKIVQNDGQSVLAMNLGYYSVGAFTPRDLPRAWRYVASSSDGARLASVVTGGGIYTSTDYGTNWVLRPSAPTTNWYSIASSADGLKLAAVALGGPIFTSTDAGTNWTARISNPWLTIASSSDGSKLIAGGNGGQLYLSTDFGTNWTPRGPSAPWYGVASSADGSKLVALNFSGPGSIYTSIDSGTNWTQRNIAGNWFSVASSADGNRLVAVTRNTPGQIFTSADAGVSWMSRASISYLWNVSCSMDGTKILATPDNGFQPYLSVDSGATWAQQSSLPGGTWYGGAVSGDAKRIVAVNNGGQIYTASPETSSSTGATGGISGSARSAIELQYIGGGRFLPLSSSGVIIPY